LGYASPLVRCIDWIVESARAQQVFHEAEHSLKLSVEEKSKAEEELADLFSPEGFGLDGEWKKLEGTCLELDTGEYVHCPIDSNLRS
jgi:protein kinase C substrate 80K-H